MTVLKTDLWDMGVRQPKVGKPHVMKRAGWWLIFDPAPGVFATWQQREFFHDGDPRPGKETMTETPTQPPPTPAPQPDPSTPAPSPTQPQ